MTSLPFFPRLDLEHRGTLSDQHLRLSCPLPPAHQLCNTFGIWLVLACQDFPVLAVEVLCVFSGRSSVPGVSGWLATPAPHLWMVSLLHFHTFRVASHAEERGKEHTKRLWLVSGAGPLWLSSWAGPLLLLSDCFYRTLVSSFPTSAWQLPTSWLSCTLTSPAGAISPRLNLTFIRSKFPQSSTFPLWGQHLLFLTLPGPSTSLVPSSPWAPTTTLSSTSLPPAYKYVQVSPLLKKEIKRKYP